MPGWRSEYTESRFAMSFYYSNPTPRRNLQNGQDTASTHLDAERFDVELSPGGRVIYRHLRRSVSLCNAIASAWAYGTAAEG